MSTPSTPYYYKEHGADTYHWELSCTLNQYPAAGWKKSEVPPAGREQCNQCKAK